MGRPTKYKPEYIAQAKNYVALGATDEQLASFFEVAVSTIYQWKLDYPEFSEALRVSKEQYDSLIERSLAERARGYSHPEDKIFCNQGETTVVSTTKHYPPDTTACIFWLKNRQPEKWRDVQERVHHNEQPEIDDLELARKLAFLLQRADDQLTKH